MGKIISVSDDQIGVLSDRQAIDQTYGESQLFLKKKGIDLGVERIGWRQWNQEQLSIGQLPLHGIHGRMVTPKESIRKLQKGDLRFGGMNLALVSNRRLSQLAWQTEANYVLVHQEAVETNKSEWIKNLPAKTDLMMENSMSTGSLKRTVEVALITRQKKENVGVMIDLRHLLAEFNDNFEEDWPKMVEIIHLAIGKMELIGFHLPIGDTADSLPTIFWEEKYLADLAKITVKKQVKYITIENQIKTNEWRINPATFAAVAKSNLTKIKRLSQAGIW